MAQLTLRTLLAYIDDTLEPTLARQLGAKVADSELAQELIEKIKRVTRRRGLKAPTPTSDEDDVSDPNTVAEYLSNSLDSEQVTRLEETCLQSDAHLAEIAACHQILTLILTEPVRVPPQARQRMYKLVKPPLSDPSRRSGRAIPIGTAPPEPREGDGDDADTTFLLGFGRYSAASVMKRVAAVIAVFALFVCLVIAVILSLPGTPPEPPDSSRTVASNLTPAPPSPSVVPPIPRDEVPPSVPAAKPKEVENPPVPPAPPPKKGNEELVKRVPGPKADRVAIGKVESVNVIVLTRADNGPNWLRLDPADEPGVTSADQVFCLPGYKADVQLESGVKVHLWGNVPELLPARLLESRVRFYSPERKAEGKGEDFDADIALLSGRIYVTSTKPAGSRIRVRLPGQVWDVTLPDAKSEVVFEAITSFDPGTPFSKEGGALPRVEIQAAVITGSATLAMPERFKTFAKVPARTAITWDSKSGTLSEPKPYEAGAGYYDRFLLVGSEQGKIVQKALSEMAGKLKERSGVRLMLAEILTEPADPNRIAATQLAVYGQAAIVFGDGAADELKVLIDLLNDEMKGYGRLATVNALAAWIAQSPGNTALLGKVLADKLRNEQDPEIILRLLRGAVSPAKPDPKDLDRLVELLSHSSVAVRELALWNLVNFVDPKAADPKAMLVTDVALLGTPVYDKFLKAWKAHIEEIKVKLMEKK
jgi:hypothetical protein